MDTLGRGIITVIAGSLAVTALATIWTPIGPRAPLEVACALAAFAGAVASALVWALHLPSRITAIRFAVLANTSIALAALAQHSPVAAMLACTPFAMLASYIALFHTAPLMAYNFAAASVVCTFEAVRMAATYNVVAALCAYELLLLLNVAAPFGIQVLVHVLGSDAIHAERDQLTGLFTRRAFQRRAKACLEQAGKQRAHVVITVIDLDRFKQLNDNYGHSAGDDALAAVASALRGTTDDTAVIGRSGGEEFVIADIWHPDDVGGKAQRLCEVIAALPFGITASVGTAGIHPAYRTGDLGDLLIDLIAAADAAMYAAKRRGGNQAGHHEWPLPPPLSRIADDETGYRDGVSA